MTQQNDHGQDSLFFDSDFGVNEQLPRIFSISFIQTDNCNNKHIRVVLEGNEQLGDIVSDNSAEDDFYRFHDIFHYSFATILGWSPCTRAMMQRKRKSNPLIDELEDGARAAITEEALSLIIFNEAKRRDYFRYKRRVSRTTLRIIKEMTDTFEVKIKSGKEWEKTILQAYTIFRMLKENKGGQVRFDALKKEIEFNAISQLPS